MPNFVFWTHYVLLHCNHRMAGGVTVAELASRRTQALTVKYEDETLKFFGVPHLQIQHILYLKDFVNRGTTRFPSEGRVIVAVFASRHTSDHL